MTPVPSLQLSPRRPVEAMFQNVLAKLQVPLVRSPFVSPDIRTLCSFLVEFLLLYFSANTTSHRNNFNFFLLSRRWL